MFRLQTQPFLYSSPSSLLRPLRTTPLRPHVHVHVRAPPPLRHQVRHQYYYYRGPRYSYQRFQQGTNLLKRWAARPTFAYEAGGLGALVGGIYVYNLETVPVSGRRRFRIVSYDTEEAMAKQMYDQVLAEFGGKVLPPWDKRTRLVERVLQRLIPASGLDDTKWEVHVIDDDQKNAFVIPGGKVFVFSGILPICGGEDGLAAVLGHEIAHNVAHHAAERMSQGFIVMGLVTVLLYTFGIPDVATQLLLEVGFMRPGSRKQELEADYIGLMMMAQSCYNPDAAVGLWARMEKANQNEPPQFLSTHPSSHNRQERIREWLPEAREKQAKSDCGSVLDYADDFRQKWRQFTW